MKIRKELAVVQQKVENYQEKLEHVGERGTGVNTQKVIAPGQLGGTQNPPMRTKGAQRRKGTQKTGSTEHGAQLAKQEERTAIAGITKQFKRPEELKDNLRGVESQR